MVHSKPRSGGHAGDRSLNLRERVDEQALITPGLLGRYRRALGWRGLKASGMEGDLSHRLAEPDGAPHRP